MEHFTDVPYKPYCVYLEATRYTQYGLYLTLPGSQCEFHLKAQSESTELPYSRFEVKVRSWALSARV